MDPQTTDASQEPGGRPQETPPPHAHEHVGAGPLSKHPLRDDPVSTLASERLTIGGRTLLALSDGFFTLDNRPAFLGTPDHPGAGYEAMSREQGKQVRMPLGAFLLPGSENVLIDVGNGPYDLSRRGDLIGGQLPTQMRQLGFTFDDINIIAISHLHSDHIGWLADSSGEPLFPNAQVHIGREDWTYFVEDGTGAMPKRVKRALIGMAEAGRVDLVDGDATIAPGVTRLAGPGHTPGHSLYVIHDRGERAVLFGDAIYCPQQLTNTDWEATSDVDPVLARRTRELYLRDLDAHGGIALGCHFPGLRAGRIISGAWQAC